MRPQKAEMDSVNSYIRDIEDMNVRQKARISYLEKELNNVRNFGRSTTPERLEPLRHNEGPGQRFESVHKAENLEKKLREAEFFHQQEIQEYKNHIKSLEFSLQKKDSDLQIMYNQADRLQQELETTNTRIRTYEMGVMDKREPLDDEINAARQKIEMLQSELSFATKAYNTELKELKSQNIKNENEVRRVGEALDTYKKKNRELVEKIVQLEKELDFSKQKPRSRTPLPLEKAEKGLHREDSRGAASPWAKPKADEKDLDTSMDNDRSRPRLGRVGNRVEDKANNPEDELKRRLEFKALQQERDIFKAQKEALERRLEKILQMPNSDENMQIEAQSYIAENEKKTVWTLRKELQEVKSQNESYKKTIEDLEEELRNIEDNDLRAEGKRETAAALRQKVIELRGLVGELEGQNKSFKTSKLEAERKVVALQSELESQNAKFSQEINGLMDYNTRLQTEMGVEKKKFVEYLQQMNKMHVERQEDQLDRKTNLEEEASKFRRLLFEKDNEIKILNTRHESEIKKLQSEIEVAKDFGDSHLREIENLKWEVEKFNDEIKRVNEAKKKAEESLHIKERQLHEAFSELNRVQKILRKAKDDGLPVQDIDAAFNKSVPQRGAGKTPDTTDFGDANYLISRQEFIKSWDANNQKAQVRPILLAKALRQKDLVQSLLQDKPTLLSFIEEALADETPEMYERAVQLMGSLIDDEELDQEDRLYPYSAVAAIKTLCPGRKDETEDLTASRHYGALVVLGFIVDTGPVWDIDLLHLAEKYSALNILIRYLKNVGGKKLWQKRRALRILKSILDTMQQQDVPEILAGEAFDLFIENIEDTDPFINRNAAEAVSILSHVPNAQRRMESEQNLSFVCRKLLKGDGKELEIYLLDCLLNLSNSRAVQEILRNHSMLDFFVSTGLDDKYPANVQVVYRLLINMAPVIEDKLVFYEKSFPLISRDMTNMDKSTKKLALALLAVIIKKNSKYDKDLILFPHIVQSLDYEDLEIQLLAIQIIFVLCARFQHPMMNCFVEERGIERCVSLYCTTSDQNVFNITGNLMLLLASAHTKYIENLLAQGGYPMVRRLFKDLEHPENQAVYRAANILRLLSTQPIFLQSLGEPNEKVASLKTFLLKLLQGVKPDEELISFGLGILHVIIVPEAIPLLRKHQIMDLLLGFLVRKVFNVQILIDVMNCLQSFLVAGVREGVVLDMIAEHYGKGIEVLSSLISPPLRRNALAQGSIGLWETLERSIQPKMIDAKYSQNLTSILKKMIDESDIPELKKALVGITQKIK